jgi:2-polyprenyl-3-methyl-5-hydroxy-6-metoxy-1,4-benzoquinol methylase
LLFPDLSKRRVLPELMDSPGLDVDRHIQALRALSRVNVLSLTAHRIWRELTGMMADGSRPLRVLDVACGGGDVVVALKEKALREGVPLDVHGCDVSPVALDHARGRAQGKRVEAHFFQVDVSVSSLPSGFDLVCSSLFLHHLADDEAVSLLVKMASCGKAILVQDLLRNRRGYALAFGTLRAVSRSPVARADGVRSVQSAFRIGEVAELANRAGLLDARIEECWPQRFALTWRQA